MEDGFYAVKNGKVFKIDPRIKMPIAKSVNVKTGEIHYPSNADRIRAMTDEELAKWLGLKVSACNENEKCGNDYTCDACWLDWLKGEVDDE